MSLRVRVDQKVRYLPVLLGLNILHLIIPSHLLRMPPACTWTWSIVWIILISWTYLFIFICLQSVSELDQLFEYLSSDHLIHLSPARMWAWLGARGWSIVWISLIWLSHLISFIRRQPKFVCKLSQILGYSSSDPLQVSSCQFTGTSGSTWIWSIVWIPLIWSSHPIPFIRLQWVGELGYLNTLI